LILAMLPLLASGEVEPGKFLGRRLQARVSVTRINTADGFACFTNRGLQTIQTYVGRRSDWRTLNNVVASYPTAHWLLYGPTNGQVSACGGVRLKSKDGFTCFTARGIRIMQTTYGGQNAAVAAALSCGHCCQDLANKFTTQEWLAFAPLQAFVTDCGPSKLKTKDGLACFTAKGLQVAQTFVGQQPDWKTLEDVVSSFTTFNWLASAQGEVTDCGPMKLNTTDGVACVTDDGVDILQNILGSQREAKLQEFVASMTTKDFLAYQPISGEVTQCK